MKKVIRLTESDLTRIVNRVIKENDEDMDYNSSIYDDIEDELMEIPNDEAIEYLKGIINHCEKLIEKLGDIKEDETTIDIPSEYEGVRMELGKSANPQEIIEMYNDLVEEGTPLVDYSEDGMFYNEDDEEIPTDVILDELNYAIVGKESGEVDDDEDYDDEDYDDEDYDDDEEEY
jgi:hypothetical protein